MCGIAGLVNKLGQPALDDIHDLLANLIHRGPDGEGVYISNDLKLAIGMRRLSIVDLKTGQQPIWNEDKDICIVCNGEIYNYIELREYLVAKGHRFSTKSDVEVL